MRVKCDCGDGNNLLKISDNKQVNSKLSAFYGDCSKCGARWKGFNSLEHKIDYEGSKLTTKLLTFFNSLGAKEQEQLVSELDPS